MSKKVKAIIAGGIVLLLLGGLLTFLLLTKEEEDDSASSSSSSTPSIELITEDEQTLESLVVKNKSGEYEIKSIGEKKWGISELADLAYTEYKYTSIVTGVSALSATSVANDSPDNLSEYGLDKPTATATTKYKNGNTHTIKVGNKTVNGSGYYVMIDADPKVYIVSSTSVEGLFYKKFDYLDTTIVPSYASEDGQTTTATMDKVVVSRPDLSKPIIIEKANKNSTSDVLQNALSITSPIKTLINENNAQTVVNGVFGLMADEIISINPSDADKKQYGFDKPSASLEFYYDTTKSVKLKVGAGIECKHEEGEDLEGHTHKVVSHYVMKEGSNIVYSVADTRLVWLEVQVEDIMSTLVLMPNVVDISNIQINVGGKDYEFVLKHSKDEKDANVLDVTCNGTTVSTDEFRSLLQLLYNTPVEKVNTAKPAGTPIMTLKYKYNIENKADNLLEVYKLTDRTSIYSFDGIPDFTGRAVYVEKIEKGIAALLAGEKVDKEL